MGDFNMSNRRIYKLKDLKRKTHIYIYIIYSLMVLLFYFFKFSCKMIKKRTLKDTLNPFKCLN